MNEPVKEPSVLDFVKSRLNPWQKEKIALPQAEPLIALEQPAPETIESAEAAERLKRERLRSLAAVPWRTLLAFGVAFYAQWLLEPSNRIIPQAIGLYMTALGLLLWAFLSKEFTLPAYTETEPKIDSQAFSRTSFIVAVIAAGVAFTLFSENSFTSLNVFLWLLAIFFFIRALWLRDPDQPSLWGRLLNLVNRESWQINLSYGAILLLITAAIVLFFRFYNLSGVPAEPFSDHAEKLLDVSDLMNGQTYIFFERNTGREFIQFYLTALVAKLFGTGLSFMSLKIGTVLIGLFALPYVYLLGKELGGPRVALFALLLAGTGYWLNTISRIGLRFPLYPAFVAPVLYYLVRGLRTQNRNDFILCGLFLGLGLHGYSPFRFAPFLVVLAVGLYLLHAASKGMRQQTLILFTILVFSSVLVFLPLMRYAMQHPDMFSYRAMSRLTGEESPLTAPDWCPLAGNTGAAVCIFGENTYRAMLMFTWDDGEIWVHSIPHRPALEVVTAALFCFGYLFLLVRYVWRRDWRDIFLLLAVPMLLMPSILSLAFPGENPSLNRTGGAGIVVFVVAALALDGLYTALRGVGSGVWRRASALVAILVLLVVSISNNYYLVFDEFATQFRLGAWNTSDIGMVIRDFVEVGNSEDNAWVVPYPYWVDTRLVGIQAGFPTHDYALFPEELSRSLEVQGSKLFIVKDEDLNSLKLLREMYPSGFLGRFNTPLVGKDFWIYTVPVDQPVPLP